MELTSVRAQDGWEWTLKCEDEHIVQSERINPMFIFRFAFNDADDDEWNKPRSKLSNKQKIRNIVNGYAVYACAKPSTLVC